MATTTNDDRRALVHNMVRAMNERNLDRLDEVMSANFVRHCEPTPDLVIKDLDSYKAFLNAFTEGFPDNVQTIEHMAVDGDLIGVFATYEGTHLGQFGPFAPTGKRAKFSFAGMFRVEDDKLAEFWVTWDQMTILGQLGLLPDAG
jgi:predicted ester cyclase